MEPDKIDCNNYITSDHFNPRAPCGARLSGFADPAAGKKISIHGLRVEPDRRIGADTWAIQDFNPRAPCGARPAGTRNRKSSTDYFNPRAPCGARLQVGFCFLRVLQISIHGLRVEPDQSGRFDTGGGVHISIHGLRVEPDSLPS